MIKATMNLELRTFEELDPKEKSKLVEKARYRECEYTDWCDWIIDDFQHELKRNGWNVKKNSIVWYAERGAIGFEGSLDIIEFAEANVPDFAKSDDNDMTKFRIFRDAQEPDVTSHVGRNDHSSTLNIEDDDEIGDNIDELSDEETEKYFNQWSIISIAIEKWYNKILEEYGKQLKEHLDYITSDEYWEEQLTDAGGYYDSQLIHYEPNELATIEEVKP